MAEPSPLSTDASIASLAGGKLSVSGLVNALAFAQGITIGDGATHTVATAPTGTCFHGQTTLAGLVSACQNIGNVNSPFYFLTDSGALTGPLCNVGATTNCFTAAAGAWKLTNASVANMDIGWLAIQAALLTKSAYVPTGHYLIGTSEALPLMVPLGNLYSKTAPQSNITGDGPNATLIMAGSSFGTLGDANTTMIPLMSCGDAGATPSTATGRWNGAGGCPGAMAGIGLYGNASLAVGTSCAYQTDGLAWGARLFVRDVYSTSFCHNVTITGDHTKFDNLQSNAGVYGLYWTSPNSALYGDLVFDDLASSGASFAALDIDGNASVAGTTFNGETYLNAGLYDIYGETNGCADILFDVRIDRLMTEYGALGVIEDGHNFSGGTYNDSKKCRSAHQLIIDRWFNQFNNNYITAQSGSNTTWRRRRATIDVNQISGTLRGLSVTGGGFVPTADNVGPAGVAVINAQQVEDASYGIFLLVEGDMMNIFLEGAGAGPGGGTVPFLAAASGGYNTFDPADGVTWNVPGGPSGNFVVLGTSGTYTTTTLGDLMEPDGVTGYNYVAPAGNTTTQPVYGVAAQAGIGNGQYLPIATSGEFPVATGYSIGTDTGFFVRSTGVGGHTKFVGGKGGTAGTYSVTATGGGCMTEPVFSVTVSGGAITAVTLTTAASGCTSAPAVATSSITGLSGGSITPQWPAAMAVTGGAPALGSTVGFGKSGAQGTPAAGTATRVAQLRFE